MSKINKLYTLILSVALFLSAGLVLSGCKDDDKCALIVFSSVGGYVQVDDSKDYVFNGDEGTKFNYKEEDIVTLKAVAKEGYVFHKWTYGTDEDEDYNANYSVVNEIKVMLNEDVTVLQAVFILNSSSFSISWQDDITYNIVSETTLQQDNKISVGSNFSFRIATKQGYDYSNMVVKCNGKVLTASEGLYTTDKIYSNITITVEGIVATSNYSVILDQGVIGCSLNYANSSTVGYGGEVKFGVDLDNAYSNSMIEVFANGVKLIPQGMQYTVSNITENIIITITGIKKNTYTVSAPQGLTDFSIESKAGYSNIVEHGGEYKFKLTTTDLSLNLANIVVEYDGLNVGKDGEGYYVISNITKSDTLVIRNIDINSFVVTLPVSEKFTIVPVGNSTTVNYNDDFKFAIIPNEGFDITNVVVTYGAKPAVKSGDLYIISNITHSDIISVNGVNKIKFTFSDINNGVYKIEFNKTTIEYGDNLNFKIKSSVSNIDISEIVVKYNNKELVKSNGEYTITEVKTNQLNQIVVEGVKQVYKFEVDYTELLDAMFEHDASHPNQFTISLLVDESKYSGKVLASSIILKYGNSKSMTLAQYLINFNNNLNDCGLNPISRLNIGGNAFIIVNDTIDSDFEVVINTNNLNKSNGIYTHTITASLIV